MSIVGFVWIPYVVWLILCAAIFFVPMFIFLRLTKISSKKRREPTKTEEDADGTGDAGDRDKLADKKTKSKEPNVALAGKVMSCFKIYLWIVAITLIGAMVMGIYGFTHPNAARGASAGDQNPGWQPTTSTPNRQAELNYVAFGPPASSRNSQVSLTVYRYPHEILVPRVTSPTKEWFTKTQNTTDVFYYRAFKDGKLIWTGNIVGIQDGNTKLPPDADDYYMSCTNADITTVMWYEKEKR